MIRGPKDMKAVNRAIKRWCDATGMKENMTQSGRAKNGKAQNEAHGPDGGLGQRR